jgi:CHC2 zinc finger
VNSSEQQADTDLLTYLRVLAGNPQRNQFFDMRYLTPEGVMRQRFISALRIDQLARRITDLARRTDVYVGVALRERAHGGKSAISGSHLLYIECDDPRAKDRLDSFAHPPTMETASGSPGHLQLYWWLCQRAANSQVESANRRLALELNGDAGCFDIARILRPPDTFNYKHDPPRAVSLLACREDARYTIAELTDGLPADPHPRGPAHAGGVTRRAGRTMLDRELRAIPAAEYVRVLAGLVPNSAGKVLCPFHDETDPSLQLYPDGTFYCYGSGCKKGGTIFDFAAALWFSGTRDQDFLELRQRLARVFGLTSTSIGGTRCH